MRCPSPFYLSFFCLSISSKIHFGFIATSLNLNVHFFTPYTVSLLHTIAGTNRRPSFPSAPVFFYHHEALLSSSVSLPLTRWPSSRSSFLQGRSNAHGGCRHPAGDVEWAVGFAFHLKDFTDAHTPSSRRGGSNGAEGRKTVSLGEPSNRPLASSTSGSLIFLAPFSSLLPHPLPTSPNPTSVSHQCTNTRSHTHAQ